MPQHGDLYLKQMELGPLQNFLYFVGDKNTKEVAVVDPAWDVDYLRRTAEAEGLTITQIFLTHGHPDHVNGLKEILRTHDVPVYISRHEAEFYMPQCKNLHKIEDGDRLKIGSVSFKTILAPGHTPGCQCFLSEGALIAGDVIFIDGCGRCDLPGGDAGQMYDSLYHIIKKLPPETVIYPGHNYGPTPYATVADQKRTNPYLHCASKEEFLQTRMGISL